MPRRHPHILGWPHLGTTWRSARFAVPQVLRVGRTVIADPPRVLSTFVALGVGREPCSCYTAPAAPHPCCVSLARSPGGRGAYVHRVHCRDGRPPWAMRHPQMSTSTRASRSCQCITTLDTAAARAPTVTRVLQETV